MSTSLPSRKTFLHVAQLRRMRGCEQVAAVCYRIARGKLEFLLVETKGGNWTFPKGSIESGLTHAQSAALEAFEEAGVHGRIEELAFAQYIQGKRGRTKKSAAIEFVVNTHLCEVLRLETPQESGRNPTWFSAERSKQRLKKGRTRKYGQELSTIVDLAEARISMRAAPISSAVPMLNAGFETSLDLAPRIEAPLPRYSRMLPAPFLDQDVEAARREMLLLGMAGNQLFHKDLNSLVATVASQSLLMSSLPPNAGNSADSRGQRPPRQAQRVAKLDPPGRVLVFENDSGRRPAK